MVGPEPPIRIGSLGWTGRGAHIASRIGRSDPRGHAFTAEQPAEEPDRLVEPVEPLAEPRAEVDAEGVVLALEPPAAEAEDEPAIGHVLDGRGELGGQPGVAKGVGGNKKAQSRSLREDGQRRQRRPALEFGVGRVALVGEQVVVDPEGVPAGAFGGETAARRSGQSVRLIQNAAPKRTSSKSPG